MNHPAFKADQASDIDVHAPAWVKNRKLIEWVRRIAALTKPARIEWCDGSEEEWERLTTLLVEQGTFTRLRLSVGVVSLPS